MDSGKYVACSAVANLIDEIRDGNDGSWSTFQVRVGSQQQPVRLLPATYSFYLSVVPPEGCPDTITNCSSQRGNLFQPSKSSTWRFSDHSKQPYGFSTSSNINGSDTVGFGSGSYNVVNQSIHLETDTSRFMGTIGLSAYDPPDLGGGNISSFLTNAVQAANIAVKSWSYTAGSVNRKRLLFFLRSSR